MNALWAAGAPASSKDLLAALPKPMALTTLLTYLSRLEEKGYVRRTDAGGRGYVYAAAVAREAVSGRLLDQLLGQFGGRFASMVSHFVRTRKLSAQERRQLRAVLDQIPPEE